MKRVWLFDLDNTLHDASAHIFPHINRSMTAYLQQHLQLDEQAAGALRMHYWQRYGATLSGMMKHHGTDPEHFLWHTHQFPQLAQMVLRAPRLRHVLQRLPGRKLIFTNADMPYAERVLAARGLGDSFEDIHDILASNLKPKPDNFVVDERSGEPIVIDLGLHSEQGKQVGGATWRYAGSIGSTTASPLCIPIAPPSSNTGRLT